MKTLYRPSFITIGRYRCVAIDNADYMVSGRKGWIFIANEDKTRLGVVTITQSGNEKLIYCDFKDLEKQISRIDILGVTPDQAAAYVNSPNLRHR